MMPLFQTEVDSVFSQIDCSVLALDVRPQIA